MMKKLNMKFFATSFLILQACVFALHPLYAEPKLKIIQPFADYDMPAVKSSFVFGNVQPTTAALTINGISIEPYKNGGFIGIIPFSEGRFTITATAFDGASTTTVTRTVNVPQYPATYAENYSDLVPISPTTRVVVRPGDKISLSFQAAPGGSAEFKINNKGASFPMYERQSSIGGVYEGIYQVQPEDNWDDSDITFLLKRKDGKKINKKAGASIIVQRRKIPRFVRTNDDTVLLTGPGSSYGYHMFLSKGVQLEVTGEWGAFLRVAISEGNSGWVKSGAVDELPAGMPEEVEVSRNIRVTTTSVSTIMEIPLQYRHPHRIQQFVNPHRMLIKLYGVIPDTDRIRYFSTNSAIKEITWSQDHTNTATFHIRMAQRHPWGYDVRYEGNSFILEIRNAPDVERKGNSLKGLVVAVDAGHTPKSFGTIGPWGNTEYSVNLEVAKLAKAEFEKRGAAVVMIQPGGEEISLSERVKRAWESKAHIFLSIHCDATGEGTDPFERQGFSVHYYQPQSRRLAEILHANYEQKAKINNQGLWRSNLAVCRTTPMISLLLELGYLILPQYEELLTNPRFQKNVADILVSSVTTFVKQNVR